MTIEDASVWGLPRTSKASKGAKPPLANYSDLGAGAVSVTLRLAWAWGRLPLVCSPSRSASASASVPVLVPNQQHRPSTTLLCIHCTSIPSATSNLPCDLGDVSWVCIDSTLVTASSSVLLYKSHTQPRQHSSYLSHPFEQAAFSHHRVNIIILSRQPSP